MLSKIFGSNIFKRVVTPIILTIIFLTSYIQYRSQLNISYWDEFAWVGRSYFFQFYIHGDFKNNIWKRFESYDQPKLTSYLYGSWIYPLYLKEKINNPEPYDYLRFLIQNGFYELDDSYDESYANYRKTHFNIEFAAEDSGNPQYYIERYGREVSKPLNLILHIRLLNVILLSLSMLVIYYFLLKLKGYSTAIIFSLLYGLNLFIMEIAIRAHSENLFVINFNLSFIFMCLYFLNKRRRVYLWMFTLFAALCSSTKLNGFIVPLTFLAINTVLLLINKRRDAKQYLIGIVPTIASLATLIITNPFTFPNIYEGTKYLFNWRYDIATHQAQSPLYSDVVIPSNLLRLQKIFNHFYFPVNNDFYLNNIYKLTIFTGEVWYRLILFIFFVNGFIYSVKKVLQRDTFSIILITSFICNLFSASYYLILDWGRYYALLPFFFILFQVFGFMEYFTHIGNKDSFLIPKKRKK